MSQYQAACGGTLEGSDGCGGYLFNQTSFNFQATDYVSREDSSMEDASADLEKEWSFIVSEFARLEPIVANFTLNGGEQMSELIADLATEVSTLRNETDPLMEWVDRVSDQLTDADAVDMSTFNRESDTAVRTVLDRAMTAAQIRVHDQGSVTGNSTLFLNKFWEKEFSRVRALADSKQAGLFARMHLFEARLRRFQAEVAQKESALSAHSVEQKLMLNVTLPNALAAQRQALVSGLQSNITVTFNNTVVPSIGSAVNSTMAEFRRQFNESLDAMGDMVETDLNATKSNVLSALDASEAVFDESDASFANAMDFFSRMLAAASNASQVDQSQTNEFVMTNADLGADSIYQFNEVEASIAAALAAGGAARGARVQTIEQEVKAYAAQVLWQMQQDMLVLAESNGTIMGQWKNYTQLLDSSLLPQVSAGFTASVNQLEDAIGQSSQIAALRGVNVSSDPRVLAFLASNYSFIDPTELENIANDTDAWKVRIFDTISAQIAQIVSELDATAKEQAVADFQLSASNRMDTIASEGAASFAASQTNDAAIQADIALRVIAAPATAELGRIQNVQKRVAALMSRLDALEKASAVLPPVLAAATAAINSPGSTIASTVQTRAGHQADTLGKIVTNANNSISQYENHFVNDLPASTGFAAIVDNKAASLQTLAQFIKTQGSQLGATIAGRMAQVNQFNDLVAYTNGSLATVSDLITAANAVPVPVFADTALTAGAVNVSSLAATINGSLLASVSEIQNALAQKISTLVSSFHDQTDLGTARDSLLTSLSSNAVARNGSIAAIVGPHAAQVTTFTGGLNTSLDQINATIGDVRDADRGEFVVIADLLAEEAAEMQHQVGEAVPEFLSTYEGEQIGSMLDQLTTLNGTINAINYEATNTFTNAPVGSLLHVGPSERLVDLLRDLGTNRTNRTFRTTEGGIEGILKTEIFSPNISTAPNITEFSSALTALLRRVAELEPLRGVVNASHANGAMLDAWSKGNSSELLERLAMVQTVLQHASETEQEGLQSQLVTLLEQKSDLESVLAHWRNSSFLESGFQSVDADAVIPVRQSVRVPAVESMQVWFDTITKDFSKKLNDQIQDRFSRHFNETLDHIDSLHKQLRLLLANEEQIETDFGTKVIPKLRDKNAQVRSQFNEETRAIKSEIHQRLRR